MYLVSEERIKVLLINSVSSLLLLILSFTVQSPKLYSADIYDEGDRDALLALYNSLENNSAKSSLGWITSQENFSLWQGIRVTRFTVGDDELVRVSGIDLSDRNLSGMIPPLRLDSLRFLDLSENSLRGDLSKLTAPFLDTLIVSDNEFSFAIDSFPLFNSLSYLDMEGNEVYGLLENLKLSPTLKHLNLSENEIEGGVPYRKFDSLVYIKVRRNKLEWYYSPILPHHEYIDLSENEIYSPFPEVVGMNNLEYLDLSLNSFIDLRPFEGPKLHTVDLRSNNFSDSIPSIRITTPPSAEWPKGYSLNLANNGFRKGYGNIYVSDANYVELSFNKIENANEKIHAPGARLFMRNNRIKSLHLDSIDMNAETLYLSDNLIDTILGKGQQNLPVIQLRQNYLTFRDLEQVPKENFETFLGSYDNQYYEVPIIHDEEEQLLSIGYGTNQKETVTWIFPSGEEVEGTSTPLKEVGNIIVEVNHIDFPELTLTGSIYIQAAAAEQDLKGLRRIAVDLNQNNWYKNNFWDEIEDGTFTEELDSLYGIQSENFATQEGFLSHAVQVDLSWNNLKGSLSKLELPKTDNIDLSHNKISAIDTIAYTSGNITLKDNEIERAPLIIDSNIENLDISYNQLPFIELDKIAQSGPINNLTAKPQYPVVELSENMSYLICKDSLESNTFTWLKNNEEIPMADSHIFQPQESGTYVCEVSNPQWDWSYRTEPYQFIFKSVEEPDSEVQRPFRILAVYNTKGQQIQLKSKASLEYDLNNLQGILPRGSYLVITEKSNGAYSYHKVFIEN